MKTWNALALLGVLLVVSGLRGEPPATAISFDDQFERKQDISRFRGDIVVVLYGDRDGMTANKALGQKIHAAFHPAAKGLPPGQASKAPVAPLPDLREGMRSPDVHVVPVACLGKTTDTIKNYIRQRVRKEAPDTAVLIDFQNKMKSDFGLKDGEPNLLVIDAMGRLRLKLNGELDEASYTKVMHAVHYLRKEAAGGR